MHVTLEQARQMQQASQEELESVQRMISQIHSLPQDATEKDMLKVLLSVQLETLTRAEKALRARIEALRIASSGIVVAAPSPGGK